ncbi:aspartate/glutamate racemase family protein [Halotia wernerae UHCC 0503]|jgi:maleate isomerase|nr:aspartate/glutamate racemase family protein [Halotia wernerae UHCC 0503]
MNKSIRIGMLTPSSNTVLEPVCAEMLRGLPGVTAHFGRFEVTEISLGERSQRQFEMTPMIAAARLLADAQVDVIGWNGTSASWLGFERDAALCSEIEAATGIKAVTSVLALVEILNAMGVTRLGLVSPYIDDVQARIMATFAASGIEVVSERHCGITRNFAFAEVPPAEIARMTRDVAKDRPQAITVLCTNLMGAPLAEELEREIDLPILDSISVVVWKALKTAGIDPKLVKGWGRLFRELH